MLRKSTFVAMGILLACTSVLLSVPTAVAASHSGDLRIKGPGNSAYTQGPTVSQVGLEGSTLTYTIQVVNTGTSLAQFLIRVSDSGVAPLQLYEGTLLLSPLARGFDGYYTRALPPGGNQVLTAKMTIPLNVSQYQHPSQISLYGTDGVFLDGVQVIGEQTAPAATIGYDLTVRAGSQKPVGNAQLHQAATAGTISSTGTATFTATLKNGTGGLHSIYFKVSANVQCPNLTVTVKEGFVNVTAAVLAGTYHTPPLSTGQSRNLTIQFKGGGSNCTHAFWLATTSNTQNGPVLRSSFMVINMAA